MYNQKKYTFHTCALLAFTEIMEVHALVETYITACATALPFTYCPLRHSRIK